MKRIVVIGGGFAGVYTVKYLRRYWLSAEIILLNDHNYFLFTPLLHEVATGGLTAEGIAKPLNQLFRDQVSAGTCTALAVNTKRKTIETQHGPLAYDILVLATGAQVNDFGVPGVKEFAIPLKSMKDAKAIRNVVIERLEEASKASKTKRKQLLSFAVVGGGPTGVELIAELAEFMRFNAETYYKNICKSDITLTLVQRGDRLLTQVKPYFQEQVVKRLHQLGVKIAYNSPVDKITEEGVHVKGNGLIKASTVFWTAGVKPRTIPLDKRTFEKGYPVNEFLQVKGYNDIFALGDCAEFIDPISNERIPMLAQVAVAQAPIAAKNIRAVLLHKRLHPYHFMLKGFLVSVGEWFAIAGIDGMLFSGRFAWWLWRTIYLSKVVGIQNKIRVASEWTLNLFFPRDVSQLD